jgi:XdhC and CoxI family
MQLQEALDQWRREQVRVAIARVVDIDHGDGVDGIDGRDPGGSADSGEPEAAEAALAVNERGEITGSVPEGCVEEALVAEALQVLAQGHAKLVTFGRHDPPSRSTWAAGLVGGGCRTVHVFLKPLRPLGPLD